MRTLILLLAVFLVVFIARYSWRKKGYSSKQILQKFALYGTAVIVLVLVLTGRVHWLAGALAAALPAIGRFLPLLRHVPLVRSLYRRYANPASGAGQTNGSAANGQTSSVQSRYLRMRLNHGSGEMDGDILDGRMRGAKLSELGVEQLIELLDEFADDHDSQALLQTYLDRVHGNWREQAGARARQNAGAARGGDAMSAAEACQILGVAPDAGEEQIIAAHRRLMQKVHPDRGGSDYLAAKINQAKDLLLKNSKR